MKRTSIRTDGLNDSAACDNAWLKNPLSAAVARALSAMVAGVVAGVVFPAFAGPTGEQVVAGQSTVSRSGATTTIDQSSQRTAINWQGFDIGAHESVRFNQPNASAIALNRVLGQDASSILGKLNANGQVFILNPNGVLFGQGAQVNVGGLVASTLAIADADFMAGRNVLRNGGSAGGVSNAGTINAQAGLVALIAPEVSNTGSINAQGGAVALAAGDRVTLNLDGNRLIGLSVDQGTLNALAENKGFIKADGGQVLLSAKAADQLIKGVVNNAGIIEANTLTAANGVIRLEGDRIDSAGTITANGGAHSAGQVELVGESVFHSGALSAASSRAQGGTINVDASAVILADGVIDASGASGGSVSLAAERVGNSARVDVRGHASEAGQGVGGQIDIRAHKIVQSTGAHLLADGQNAGGDIHLQGHNTEATGLVFSSGTLSATGDSGGSVTLSGDHIDLRAASLDASGASQGGLIHVGGGWQGAPISNRSAAQAAIGAALPISQTLDVNAFTSFKADATVRGNGGEVVLWSGEQTLYQGSLSARGGVLGGDGGRAEVSSKNILRFGGQADLGASQGSSGLLLLDPKNIIIDSSGSASLVSTELANPDPAAGESHGGGSGLGGVTVLTNDNIVVATPEDDFAAVDAGGVYLYHGQTGALISSLRGSAASDQVGYFGVTALNNGNFVVNSPYWNNGTATTAGAVTWGNGTSGVAGTVSAANSLVGTTTNDVVGGGHVTALSNGNYVVRSHLWNNGALTRAGAVTWGGGTSGVTGAVSAANSLVGTTGNGQLGSSGVTALSNGNYVVSSYLMNIGAVAQAGAVTWGNGMTGIVGTVSAANSLVGTTASDHVGRGGVTALSNGNYVVSSYEWKNGLTTFAGAVTWGDGTTGLVGVVSAANSLVGATAGDRLGRGGVTALSNGNFVVSSFDWDNGAVTQAGAVTWGNGTSGLVGTVSAANSLVGTTAGDQVGDYSGVTALSNGNYVVTIGDWDNGAVVNAGAVTWGNGTTGTVGVVSAANSLVGTTAGDRVGNDGVVNDSVTALSNGNYVVSSDVWNNGTATRAGAVTWGNGTTGVIGAVSAANSLVGTTAGDQVGYGGVTALSNGNYVVTSNKWKNGAMANAGAATWGDGTTGIAGAVSAANSLVGTTANDGVGGHGVTALSNGNYVVSSGNWDNGVVTNVGAATWGSGTSGITGAVSAANSLVGTTANDSVGNNRVTALSNGNFVVGSPSWNNGGAAAAGAATWGNGTSGSVGAVSAANSLVGTTALDQVGGGSVSALSDGRFVVSSPRFGGTQGRVEIVSVSVNGAAGDQAFGVLPGADVTLSAAALAGLLGGGTNVSLQANNDITVAAALNVAGGAGGDLSLQAGRSIVFDASVITANGSLNARANDPNAVLAQRDAGSGDIVIGAGVTIDVGTGIAQLAGQRLINNSDANALQASGAGRWLVWSADPANDTRGGLAYDFKQYNATYGTTAVAQATGNGLLYTLAPSLTPGLAGMVSKVYDAGNVATLTAGNFIAAGAVDGDSVTLTASGATYADKNVGNTKNVAATGIALGSVVNGTATVYGYQLGATTANASIGSITPATLTVNYTGVNRAYDATIAATVGTGDDRLGTDVLTINRSAAFVDKNVANGKTVNVTGVTLSGSDAGNYAVAASGSTTAHVTPATLTVNFAGVNKIYDATTSATVGTSDDRLGTDVLTINSSAAFIDKNVANGKAVNVAGVTLSGTDAGNYTLAATTGATTASISSAQLSIRADDKTKVVDDPLPVFTATYAGFVGGEGIADLAGGLNFVTPATQVSPPASYAIDAMGHTAANYSITYMPGTLTVNTAGNAQLDGAIAAARSGSGDESDEAMGVRESVEGLITIVGSGVKLPPGVAQ